MSFASPYGYYQAPYQVPTMPQQMPGQIAQSAQVQQPQGLNGRMVTSKEEALGVPVDFMGGVTILPDIGHGRIYTKVFNPNTGAADFLEYRLAPAESPAPAVQFAPMAEIEKLRAQVETIQQALQDLQKEGSNE